MFSAALEGGRGAANMWSTFTAAYQRLGLERPPATLADMNTFVSGLGRIISSSARLMSATDTDALTSEHWAYPIGYEPSPVDSAAPSMLVTYQTFIDTSEGTMERWSSLMYNGYIPATVGEIRSDATSTTQTQLDMSAMEEGDDSPTAGGQVLGLGTMYITGRGL
jgi:hypothetical protein